MDRTGEDTETSEGKVSWIKARGTKEDAQASEGNLQQAELIDRRQPDLGFLPSLLNPPRRVEASQGRWQEVPHTGRDFHWDYNKLNREELKGGY